MSRSVTRFRAPFVLTLATLSVACGDSSTQNTLSTTCPAPSTVRWAMITMASCDPPMPDASVSD